VDEALAAFGEAIDAYNAFVRSPDRKGEPGAKLAADAAAKLDAFLALTKPKPDADPDKASLDRRRTAVTMLITIHRVRSDYAKAIAYLEAIPRDFPREEDDIERRRLLAHCHLLLSQRLADKGETEKAKASEAVAVDLLEGLMVKGKPGENPTLELWVAGQLFDRGRWEDALEIYRQHAERLEGAKGKEKEAAFVYRRIVKCCIELRRYMTASHYLRRLRGILGPSLEMLREEAQLERLRGRYSSARKIYQSMLPRLAELSPEWWQTYYDLLDAALLEGRNQYVAKEIGKLQVLYPDLGDPRTRARLLDLYRRAEQATRG